MAALPRNVWALGLVSLFTDLASEMCVPVFPLLLAGLGGGAAWLGLMEGGADAVAALVKWRAGSWSDSLARRKPLVLAGYVLATLTRPFYAFAGHAVTVVGIRAVDRVGKGLRSAPRDALLAESVPSAQRAEAFGLHRSMDHAGAVLGPLVAALALWAWPQEQAVRWIFLMSLVPGVLSVAALLAVHETPHAPAAVVASPQLPPTTPGQGAVLFLVVVAVFGVFRLQEVLLLVRLGSLGVSPALLPLCWSALHIIKSVTGRPLGAFADKVGAHRALPLGYLVYAVTVLATGLASGLWGFAVALGFYALHHGLTEGVEKAMLSRLWPKRARGAGFGVYHALTALVALPAGATQGWLLETHGGPTLGVVLAGGALLAVVLSLRLPAVSADVAS